MAMARTSSRPNFLFIMPDQLRADAVGVFGSPVAQTPHIDALASRGTRFTEAFAQHSVCSPSRVSLLTGWYPHVAGHRTLTNLIKKWEPNLLRTLRNGGYRVAWTGQRGDTFAPGVTEESVDEYGWSAPPTAGRGTYPQDRYGRAFYIGRRKASEANDFDEAAIVSACSWLEQPPAENWSLFVTLMVPHVPFYVEEPWFSLHDRSTMPRPRPRPTGPVPRYVDTLHERYGLDSLTQEDWAEIAATYHGMVSRVDDQVGRLMASLARGGGLDNTVVVFFTDHGEYLGDYGLVEKWPSGLHECLLREPLILAGPGIKEGVASDQIVEMIDFVPTITELAHLEASYTQFGKSLVPILRGGWQGELRDAAFSEGGFLIEEEPLYEHATYPYDLKAAIQHEDPITVGKAVAMRTREWTYIYRLYESDELYDRRADPGETANLINEAHVAGEVEQCRSRVLRWLVETSDVIEWSADPRWPKVSDRPFG